MAWIESHQKLERHPKLLDLCHKTGWNLDEAIGKLQRLWWWALDFAEDGDLSKFQPVQYLSRLDGAKLPDELHKILIDTKFLNENDLIHDWLDYAGRYLIAKYRTSNSKRLKAIFKKHKTALNPSKVGLKSGILPNQPNQDYLPNIKEYFEALWEKYPRRVGKKQAYKHFQNSIKGEEGFKNCEKALDNYLNSERVFKGYVQNGSTWFNNWEDWIDYKEEVCPKCKNRGKYQASTGYEIICSCSRGEAIKLKK